LKVLSRILTDLSMNRSYKEYVKNLKINGSEAILEFGCGKGALSKRVIKKLNKGGYLTCSDISDLSLKDLKTVLRKHENINCCLGDIRKINMDNIYDKIIINSALDYIPKNERLSYLNFLLNLLKPDGKIFIRQYISINEGISSTEVRRLMRKAKLKEIDYKFDKTVKKQLIYFGEFKRT